MKRHIFDQDYMWVWLIVHKGKEGYSFSIIERVQPTLLTKGPFVILQSVYYSDLIFLFYHALFLADIANRMLEIIHGTNLSKSQLYEYRASYLAILQGTFFDSRGTPVPMSPINTTARKLERRFNECLADQARKTWVHQREEQLPSHIDRLWGEFYSFDFGGRGEAYHDERLAIRTILENGS